MAQFGAIQAHGSPWQPKDPPPIGIIVVLPVGPDARNLRISLASQGFDVTQVPDAAACLEAAQRGRVDLFLICRSLPGEDGLMLCRLLSERPGKRALVMVVGESGSSQEAYDCFEAGACDYLRQPLDPFEVVWRARAHLAQAASDGPLEQLVAGNVVLDLRNHLVGRGDRDIPVTPSECAILHHLMIQPGRAVTIERLLVEALGYPPRLGNPEVVRTHVRNLRIKLEPDPRQPRMLINRPRVGYVFQLCEAQDRAS